MYTISMADIDLSVLRELFNTRFDSMDAKLASMLSMLEKENDRQDETIERLADRTTHVNETRRLEKRIEKLETQMDGGQRWLNKMEYKVKVTWSVGIIAGTLFLSVLAALIKGYIGV